MVYGDMYMNGRSSEALTLEKPRDNEALLYDCETVLANIPEVEEPAHAENRIGVLKSLMIEAVMGEHIQSSLRVYQCLHNDQNSEGEDSLWLHSSMKWRDVAFSGLIAVLSSNNELAAARDLFDYHESCKNEFSLEGTLQTMTTMIVNLERASSEGHIISEECATSNLAIATTSDLITKAEDAPVELRSAYLLVAERIMQRNNWPANVMVGGKFTHINSTEATSIRMDTITTLPWPEMSNEEKDQFVDNCVWTPEQAATYLQKLDAAEAKTA